MHEIVLVGNEKGARAYVIMVPERLGIRDIPYTPPTYCKSVTSDTWTFDLEAAMKYASREAAQVGLDRLLAYRAERTWSVLVEDE